MFYCPKCQQTYEETAQRFCLNDGARLLPAPSTGKSVNQTGGVFAKILNRNSADGNTTNARPGFSPPAGKMFKAEEDLLSLPDINPPEKPLPRIIKPSEVPTSQATLGDRKINPTGRPALSWENPNVLLRQTIKNRYLISKKIAQDENSIAYLADDKLVANKRVTVTILMEQDASDKLTSKIFAEERVSLSHINHPNVANVIDSGELLEGNPFIIAEYVEGASIKEMLYRKGEFNALRTARIVRQVANALSAVHQSGILHRNLRPESIILMLTEEGAEQVKLINFGVPSGKANKENLRYKSPEQLEENVATFACDLYSLAVIAFEMLTNRLPFNDSSVNALLKSQREGLTLRPTDLRFDLPESANDVFEKALAYSPSERYRKARDLGDAFYSALNAAVAENDDQSPESEKIELPPNEKVEENVRKAFGQTEEMLLPALPLAAFVDAGKNDGFFELEIPPVEDNFRNSVGDIEDINVENINVEDKFKNNEDVFPAAANNLENNADVRPFISAAPISNKINESEVKSPKDSTWEKRSLEPPKVASPSKMMLSMLGVAALLAGMFAVWYYVWNRPNNALNAEPPTESVRASAANIESAPPANFDAQAKSSPVVNIEVPPAARSISQPPDTIFFETSKQNLKGDLLRNFVGFSLFYPKDWIRNEAANNFIDVAKKSADGKPIEQLLVSYYESNGTFDADNGNFPKLTEKSNRDLAKIIPNYQAMSEGEIKVNGDWRAYEVKFQGGGKIEKGEKNLIIWGRRIWIPAARPGTKNGFVVTMLATSLSPEITSVNDIGNKGDLATVFGTFEPNQNF